MVSAVNVPDKTLLPTPMTPPNAEIKSVPSDVTESNFFCSESIIPYWSLIDANVALFLRLSSRAGALSIKWVP